MACWGVNGILLATESSAISMSTLGSVYCRVKIFLLLFFLYPRKRESNYF